MCSLGILFHVRFVNPWDNDIPVLRGSRAYSLVGFYGVSEGICTRVSSLGFYNGLRYVIQDDVGFWVQDFSVSGSTTSPTPQPTNPQTKSSGRPCVPLRVQRT